MLTLSTHHAHAPQVHPATLVKYEDRAQVMGKLCDLFLDGVIPLTDLNNVMECGFDTWKITLYNYLPEDWQPFHRYLAADQVKTIAKSPEFKVRHDMLMPLHGLMSHRATPPPFPSVRAVSP